MPDSTEFTIQVTSEDPKKKDEKDKDKEEGNQTGAVPTCPRTLRTLIRTSTSSMTSVPKPLKFLRPLYPDLQVLYETWSDSEDKVRLSYPLAVILMVASVSFCGLRHLAAELGDEYTFVSRRSTHRPARHGPGAGIVDEVAQLVDDNTYNRVCQYMIRCVNLLPPGRYFILADCASIYVQHHRFPEALALAIRLGDPDLIEKIQWSGNPSMKRQLAFLLARAQTPIEWLRTPNSDSKSLEDVHKTHLQNKCHTGPNTFANVDSACGNLVGTFVNALLIVEAEEGSSWVYKNKEHGMMSATASLGLSLLWDTDLGLSHVDKYTYSSEEYIKAGALLATGILNSGVRTEADVAKGLIGEYVDNKSVPLKTSAIMGLALAYAGSHREDLLQLLIPHISDDATMEIASLATLALGFIFVGSENGEITSTILQTLMEKAERGDIGLDEKWARFMALGLGLLYLGLQDASDTTIETLKAIEHPISKTAQIVVEACAFAGTGNVLKVQAMLHHCDEHIDMKEKEADKDEKKEEKKDEPAEGAAKEEAKPEGKPDDTFQAFAAIAVALIAMGEDMHYGEPVIRKSVPLAIGLVSISNPQLPILDTLSKYSHDNDLAVAFNAILAMGLVGAGTNNVRLAQMLRQLAGYYYKEPDCLFMVRVAQGLVHMGKGTIGLNLFFTDRSIMSRPAMAGLLATLTAFTDAKHLILDKYHWMMYFLVTAMYPRFLITVDEELNSMPVTVRVGQTLDVVGQAGKPRTILGFQTHQTPVKLAATK
ncbi:armadillo-type protein [Mycena leptocephala]|nr:armadillo-type protein [Mycena leptocephala]